MKTNKHHILFEDFFDNDLEDELLPDDELDSDYVQDPETLKKNAEFIFQIKCFSNDAKDTFISIISPYLERLFESYHDIFSIFYSEENNNSSDMKMDSSFCKIYYSFYNNINTNILYLFFKSFFRIFDYRKYISLEILQNKPGLKTLFKLNDNICTTELSIAGAFFINNLWDSYVKRFSAKRLIKCFSDNFNKEDAYLYNTLYDYKTVSAFVPLFFLIDIKNTEIYSRFSNYVYLNLDISFNDDIMHGNSVYYARNKDIFIFDEKEFKAALQTSSTKHELEIIPTEKNKIFNPEQKIIAIWHNSFITIKRGGGVSIPGLVVEYKFADSLK